LRLDLHRTFFRRKQRYLHQSTMFIKIEFNLKMLIKTFKYLKIYFEVMTGKGIMNLYMRG